MKWWHIFLLIVLCMPSAHAVDVLTGDDSDQAIACVDGWKQDALAVALKSGDRQAPSLVAYLQRHGVPALPLASEGIEVKTMRIRFPQEAPQVKIVPVHVGDKDKASVWKEVYDLNQLWTYRPDLRLLVGKDTPCSPFFRGITLLGRAEESQAYALSNPVNLESDVFMRREVRGLLYSRKLAKALYGQRFANWLDVTAGREPAIAFNLPFSGKPPKYYYQLEGLMGPSLSPDERAERQRQVCLWIQFARMEQAASGSRLEQQEAWALEAYYGISREE